MQILTPTRLTLSSSGCLEGIFRLGESLSYLPLPLPLTPHRWSLQGTSREFPWRRAHIISDSSSSPDSFDSPPFRVVRRFPRRLGYQISDSSDSPQSELEQIDDDDSPGVAVVAEEDNIADMTLEYISLITKKDELINAMTEIDDKIEKIWPVLELKTADKVVMVKDVSNLTILKKAGFRAKIEMVEEGPEVKGGEESST